MRYPWNDRAARPVLVTLTAIVVLTGAVGARAAATTPEHACQKGRYSAAAKYDDCEEKATSSFFGRGAGEVDPQDLSQLLAATSKCRAKYVATWTRLQGQAAGTGSTCDHPRYQDNSDGTVTDRLTGLQWEQKTDDATIHDKDNTYPVTMGAPYLAANGTAFTTFLSTLNAGCFAGQCDWRLPTRGELQTILLEGFPCATHPCIDEGVFGPTTGDFYWTSKKLATNPSYTWAVYFYDGDMDGTINGFPLYARAVRGGL